MQVRHERISSVYCLDISEKFAHGYELAQQHASVLQLDCIMCNLRAGICVLLIFVTQNKIHNIHRLPNMYYLTVF